MQDAEQQLKQQQQHDTVGPTKCKNECGFFGSPQTNYLCSKCFALSRKRKDTDELGSSSSKTQQEETTIKPVTKQAKLEPPCELKTDVAPTSNAVAPLSSPTTDLIKCGTCKKKLGLTAIKCRCGFKYCSKHRYPSEHNCSFDFKTAGQEELRQKNPLVVASKIQTI